MKLTTGLFCLLLATLFFSCKKKEAEPLPPLTIEGFQLFDVVGNTMGRIGPADNDWQLRQYSSLTQFEQKLLDKPDTTTIQNTAVTNVAFYPYPNPVTTESRFAVSAGDSVKLKLLMVDNWGTVLKQYSLKFKGNTVFAFNVSDRTVFPLGKSVRCYYSFSAVNAPHFKVGHGDIKICDYVPGQSVEHCFK